MHQQYTARQPSFFRDCSQCSQPFKVNPSADRKAPVKFCSRPCYWAAESQGHETRTCETCGAPFTRPMRASDAGNARRFCSQACYLVNRRRDDIHWADRFWLKVNKTKTCWLWIGSVRRGYGDFIIDWAKNTHRSAHRLAYELTYGPITDGLFVLHDCPSGDNPLCVRPSHLFLGTQADNMRDMTVKGRRANTVLTPELVRDARRRHADEGAGVSALARECGVTRATMRKALDEQSWQHV